MKKKYKDKIETTLNTTLRATTLGQFTEETINNVSKFHTKFIEIIFQAITTITLFWALLWFFPTYLNVSESKIIIIALLLILTHLRFGKTDIILKEEE